MAYAFTRQAGPKGEPDKTHYGTFYGSLVFFVMVQKSGKKTRFSRASPRYIVFNIIKYTKKVKSLISQCCNALWRDEEFFSFQNGWL